MAIHHQAIHHQHLHNPPAIVMKVNTEELPVPLTDKLKKEYNKLFKTVVIRPKRLAEVTRAIQKIETGRQRYISVSAKTGVPWYVIGLIHLLECDCRFDCHLHNGDSLKRRTKNDPAGRPVEGKPPFGWEYSAIDALKYEGFDAWTDWSPAGTLFKLESYNGFGSRNRGVASPYLWGGTTFYSKGKYVKDGVWDPNKVSAQVGAGAILKTMVKFGIVSFTQE